MAPLLDPEDLATATIRGEAEGESHEGRLAVAKVIRNRMAARFFSDGTLAGTVLKPYQFSVWNTAELRRIQMACCDRDDEASRAARLAWQESATWVGLPSSAVMYHATTMPAYPEWAKPGKGFRAVITIGRHIFYERA